jgi:hypothetical protein
MEANMRLAIRCFPIVVSMHCVLATAWGAVEDCLKLTTDRAVTACADRYRPDAPATTNTHPKKRAGAASVQRTGDYQLTAQNNTQHISGAATNSAPPPAKQQGASDNNVNWPATIMLLGGALWVALKILEGLANSASKAAKATVAGAGKVAGVTLLVGAAAAGVAVGIVEGGLRRLGDRYSKCPYCLSIIRSQASVCKNCLRNL